MVYQTLRVNNHDVDKAQLLLKKYASINANTKYLLAKEVGTQTGKPHLQGWAVHHSDATTKAQIRKALNSFSKYVYDHYPEFRGKSDSHNKCCSHMHTPSSYIPYIIHNSNKAPVLYADLVTNYTEEEYQELFQKYDFVESRTHKLDSKPSKKFADIVFDRLESLCVDDGIIDYSQLMSVFVKYYTPTRVGMNPRRVKDLLDGYTWRLEQKYPKNTRIRYRYYNQLCRLDDDLGIYQDNTFKYLKADFLIKNASESEHEEASDTEEEGTAEDAEGSYISDCQNPS